MPGMPYHLEKGPLLSVLDDFCNGSSTRLTTALGKLRGGTPLTQIGLFDSPNLYAAGLPFPYGSQAQLIAHFEQHWLGSSALNAMTAGKQTGHWQYYVGPVEQIMRQTLIRAAELSLGVKHDPTDHAPTPTRHWPIDFWWKCPQPWFEGWVTWRQGGGAGKVTVIFATPSDDGVVLRRPEVEANPAPDLITTETEGSWLISAEEHQQTVQVTVFRTGKGAIVFPTTWTTDIGQVVTLAPKFGSGGAKDKGRPYLGSG